MMERPIIMRAESVRAILAGAKTQTRPIVTTRHPLTHIGPRGSEDSPDEWGYHFDGPRHNGYMVLGRGHNDDYNHGHVSIRCPYGEVGDRLWVQETYSLDALTVYPCPSAWYRADNTKYDDPASREHSRGCKGPADGRRYADCFACAIGGGKFRWRSPLSMPRELARLTLEITMVRVQRLQQISEADARAEGVRVSDSATAKQDIVDTYGMPPYRAAFACNWEATNGKRRRREYIAVCAASKRGCTRTIIDESATWDANPWVWALTFRRSS